MIHCYHCSNYYYCSWCYSKRHCYHYLNYSDWNYHYYYSYYYYSTTFWDSLNLSDQKDLNSSSEVLSNKPLGIHRFYYWKCFYCYYFIFPVSNRVRWLSAAADQSPFWEKSNHQRVQSHFRCILESSHLALMGVSFLFPLRNLHQSLFCWWVPYPEGSKVP